MYQRYPLAIILLYYEVATEQVWQRQQTEFRNLLSECCDYFVSRHGKLNLIVNTTEKIGAQLPVPEKHLKRSYFTVSYRTGSGQTQKGGTEQLNVFLKRFFQEEISLPLAKMIASKEYDTVATPQEFFSLGGEHDV